MIRTVPPSLRLMGATVAVAATIAGFSSVASSPAPSVPAHRVLAVVTSYSTVGQ